MNREATRAFETVGKMILCYVACFLFCSVEGHVGSVVPEKKRENGTIINGD
jgi:hypothetical protein